jgi:hypothetical protein
MAKRPVSDFLRFLSAKYGVIISYDGFHRRVMSGLIPASRNDKGTRWLIDDVDEPVIVEALDIAAMPPLQSRRPLPIQPAGKPSAKPKPASKPAPSARTRATRSASAA